MSIDVVFFRILTWGFLISNLGQTHSDIPWHCKDTSPTYSFLTINLCSGPSYLITKFVCSIAMILFIARKHEFQIAHIPIWTSVSDVGMKFYKSARITYPPSSPVPHCGEGV